MKRSSSPRRRPRPEPMLVARFHVATPRRAEPQPSLPGLPGRPWHAHPIPVPVARALPRPAGLGRRATDPLGFGWPTRRGLHGGPAPGAPSPVATRPSPRIPTRARRGLRPAPAPADAPAALGSGPGVLRAAAVPPPHDDAPAPRAVAPAGIPGPLAFLPAILFTGDAPVDPPAVPPEGWCDEAPDTPPGHAPRALPAGLVDDVWLQPRDPLAWVAHWSANPAARARMEQSLGRGRWWLRLRDPSRDGVVLAERPATEHEGSAILPLDPPGSPCVAELGYDAFHSGWHPVARAHAPGSPAQAAGAVLFDDPGPAPDATPAPGPAHAPGVPSPVHGPSPTAAPETQRAWEAWQGHDATDSAAWVGGGGGPAPGARGAVAGASPGGPRPEAAPEVPASGALARPAAGPDAAGQPFRFAINVEVIIHGGTEPDARVAVGGRPVALRPDGSFSLRWVLPDGDFRVPAVAVSRDGRERREARLRLLRGTATVGGVGVHGLASGAADPITGWAG